MKDHREDAAGRQLRRLPKKEALRQLEREREKLERNLGGIKELTRLPGAICS